VIGAYVAIDVEEPDGVGLVPHPALRQPLAELRGLAASGQFPELAPQGFHFGRAIQAQQHTEFARPEFEDVRQASARIASRIAGPMTPTAERCSYTPYEKRLVDMRDTRA
jgi:hypothetical protein